MSTCFPVIRTQWHAANERASERARAFPHTARLGKLNGPSPVLAQQPPGLHRIICFDVAILHLFSMPFPSLCKSQTKQPVLDLRSPVVATKNSGIRLRFTFLYSAVRKGPRTNRKENVGVSPQPVILCRRRARAKRFFGDVERCATHRVSRVSYSRGLEHAIEFDGGSIAHSTSLWFAPDFLKCLSREVTGNMFHSDVILSAGAVCIGVFFVFLCEGSCSTDNRTNSCLHLLSPLLSSLAASCLCTRYSWRWPSRHTMSSCCGNSPRPSPGACPRRRGRITPPRPREKPTGQASTTDVAAVAVPSFARASQGLARGRIRGLMRGTISGTKRSTIRGTSRGTILRQTRPATPSGGIVAGAWRCRLMVRRLRRRFRVASAGGRKGRIHLPAVSESEEAQNRVVLVTSFASRSGFD